METLEPSGDGNLIVDVPSNDAVNPDDLQTPEGTELSPSDDIEVTPSDSVDGPLIILEVKVTVTGASKVIITFEDEDGNPVGPEFSVSIFLSKSW